MTAPRKRTFQPIVWCLLASLAISGCDRSNPVQPSPSDASSPTAAQPATPSLQASFWPDVPTLIHKSQTAAQALDTSIKALLSTPNQATLSQAQTDWQALQQALELLNPWLQLAMRAPSNQTRLEPLYQTLLTWPIAPGVLDAFGPYAYSGVVFDIALPLAEDNLRNQHLAMGEEEALLGLYPLQYCLLGISGDRSVENYRPPTALTDAQATQGYQTLEELPVMRRRKLLRLLDQALRADIQALKGIWQASETASALEHLTQSDLTSMTLSLVAEHMGQLAELTATPETEFGWKHAKLVTLYQRIHIQLPALKTFAAETPALDDAKLETAIAHLANLTQAPPGTDFQLSAKALYQALSGFAALLQHPESAPAPTAPPNTDAAQ